MFYFTKNCKGFVLPFVMALIVIMTLLGYGFLALGLESRVYSARQVQAEYSRSAADAGVSHAFYKLNKKLSSETVWTNDVSGLAENDVSLSNSNSSYSFTITGESSSGYTIESTGVSNGITTTIHATTRLITVFDFALLMKNNITLYAWSAVKAFNSTTGATGLSTQIAVNSTYPGSVIIMNHSVVNGDVYIGVNGDSEVVIDNRGTITGDIETLPYYINMPEVTAPTTFSYKGQINNTVSLDPSESGRYSQINLGNSEIITVDGGNVVLYVTGDAEFKKDSGITVEDGSTLTIYIDGDWVSKNDTDMNVKSGVPSNLRIYGTGGEGQTFDFKAKSDFYGVLYAPEADIELKAKGDVYGSIVGDSYTAKSKSTFYYDTALANPDINDEGVLFTVGNWREE